MHAVYVICCCNNYANTFSFVVCLQNLLNAIETSVSYAMVRYNTHLPVVISESNLATGNNVDYLSNRALYYQKRTFPLVLSTLALIRNPDKVLFRMLFDYKVSRAV